MPTRPASARPTARRSTAGWPRSRRWGTRTTSSTTTPTSSPPGASPSPAPRRRPRFRSTRGPRPEPTPGDVTARAYRAGVAVFLVSEENGPAWDDGRPRREQAGWDEHGAFMDRLLHEGFVVLGGPVGDGERALLAVEAADAEEVSARLAA